MSDFISEHLPRIKPFSGKKEDFDKLVELAKQDNHGVLYPTDVIWKGGEMVGWFSLGSVPTLWAWLSTRKLKVRDTLALINTMESVAFRNGAPALFMPCFKESPFHPYIEKIGYENSGTFDFFVKKLGQ